MFSSILQSYLPFWNSIWYCMLVVRMLLIIELWVLFWWPAFISLTEPFFILLGTCGHDLRLGSLVVVQGRDSYAGNPGRTPSSSRSPKEWAHWLMLDYLVRETWQLYLASLSAELCDLGVLYLMSRWDPWIDGHTTSSWAYSWDHDFIGCLPCRPIIDNQDSFNLVSTSELLSLNRTVVKFHSFLVS